jgi:hypothetical protein
MAPERLDDNGADAHADLWALGCVLHDAAGAPVRLVL